MVASRPRMLGTSLAEISSTVGMKGTGHTLRPVRALGETLPRFPTHRALQAILWARERPAALAAASGSPESSAGSPLGPAPPQRPAESLPAVSLGKRLEAWAKSAANPRTLRRTPPLAVRHQRDRASGANLRRFGWYGPPPREGRVRGPPRSVPAPSPGLRSRSRGFAHELHPRDLLSSPVAPCRTWGQAGCPSRPRLSRRARRSRSSACPPSRATPPEPSLYSNRFGLRTLAPPAGTLSPAIWSDRCPTGARTSGVPRSSSPRSCRLAP